MKIRKEFLELFPVNTHGALLSQESHYKIISEYFIIVRPLKIQTIKKSFWNGWVPKYLNGRCLCYSSDGIDTEWWGFENKNDALIFKMVW